MFKNTSKTTCVLFDVSMMQAFNDENGWDAGDKVLAGILPVLVKYFPEASQVTRLSGDEFLVMEENENTDLSVGLAWKAAEEIRDCFGVVVAFGIGTSVSARDAKKSAALELFKCRIHQ